MGGGQVECGEPHRATRAAACTGLADERARVSRELHDIVAHAVTVMLVHAAAGRRAVANGTPDTAGEALRVIEEVGGQAINELRRMLGLLRADTPEPAPEPLPMFDAVRTSSRVSDVPAWMSRSGRPAIPSRSTPA